MWAQINRRCIMFGLLMASAGSANGDTFTYTAQTRSVFAKAAVLSAGPAETLTAPDFADFDATAQVTLSPGGFATQHQRSVLGAQGISISGDFNGFFPGAAGNGSSRGRSITDVTFTVSETTGVYLMADMKLSGFNTFFRSVQLSGPGMNISWTTPIAGSLPEPFYQIQGGVLTPGSYHMRVDLESGIFPPTAGGTGSVPSFNVVLAVPEPASIILLGFATVGLIVRRRK